MSNYKGFKIVRVHVDNDKEFYLTYIKHIILPNYRIPYQAGKMLALFMYYYNDYINRGISMEEALKKTFDYDTYEKIRSEMNLSSSQAVYNVMSGHLKKEGLLIGDKGTRAKNFAPGIVVNSREHINGVIINYAYPERDS